MDLAEVRRLLLDAVPFNRVLGVSVESVAEEEAVVALPEAPSLLNHVGTVHAAAQFGLGEATSGAMVMAAFGDLVAGGIIPLAAEATIRYRRAARGALRGVARLARAEQTRARADLSGTGRARFVVAVELRDGAGEATTALDVTWVLLRPREGA